MEKTSLDRLAHIANLHDIGIKKENDDYSPRPRRLACTGCRQQKSKCDAKERHPLPCTRCMKKNLPCSTEKEFKRTDKRQRLALIERELKQLKDSFSQSPQIPPYSPSPRMEFKEFERGVSGPGTFPSGISAAADNAPNVAAPSAHGLTAGDLFCEEKSLGDLSLGPALIADLYQEYVLHYHPLLPVIDVSKGPERIHRLCPALFWVIMFVALRRKDHSKQLLLGLTPHIKNILAEITISPITRYNPTEADEPIMNACSVYSVQAFILYTLWPPLTSSLSADSSWNTIGVALFQAIRIGLNSVEPSSAMAQEQTRTWVLCNTVLQNIATAFGFPAFVQFDFLAPVLPETRHLMELAHFEDQVAKTLMSQSHGDMKDRMALLKVLIQQLADLEVKHLAESDDAHRKFHSIVARIHLLTCYFLDAEHIPAFELSKGLVRLFNASVSLIEHVQMCEAKSRDFVKYLPVVQVLNMWQASCFIVKLANSPLKSVIDLHAAKESYTAAIRLVAKASVLKHDIAYRASGIMRNMWQLFRTLDEKNMTGFVLKIRSRMMASVFFDCLSLMRDQVGMAKLNIKTDEKEGLYDSEEAIESSDEEIAQGSLKTTPGSSGSSATRKKRTLSGVHDAEIKARRIIRTIPLDPQPISARGSIFKVLNSDTSSPRVDISPSFRNENGALAPSSLDFEGRPERKKELDMSSLFDMNNESLWKDVDSLMNDFAFPG